MHNGKREGSDSSVEYWQMDLKRAAEIKRGLQKDSRDAMESSKGPQRCNGGCKKATEIQWGLHKGLRDVIGASKGSQRCYAVLKRVA